MAAYIQLPNGSSFEVRPGETPADAFHKAAQQYPEAFGIEQKHGGLGAFKQAMGQYVADTATGASELPGMAGLRNWAAEYSKPSTEPGAWQPTTKDVVANTKGFFPTAKAVVNQYVAEPLASMAGGLAIPIGAGTAVGAMSGPAGFITGPATTIAAAAPSEYARNRVEAEQAAQARAAAGEAPDETSKTTSLATAILQGALYTGAGPLGKLTHKAMASIGPDVALLTKAVERGELTKEAASATLHSKLRNVVESGIGNAVGGTEMMVGTEAMRMGQAGKDMTSPEAMARYGTGVHEAGALALPLSLMGLRTRGQQMKPIEAADKKWQGANEQAAAMGGDRLTYEQKMQENLAGAKDTTGALDIGIPEQPTGKKVYKGNEADNLPEPTETAIPDVLDKAFFDTLKVPKKSPLRSYEGMALDDPRIEELRTRLTDAAESTKDPEVVKRMQFGLDKLRERTPEERQQDMFQQGAEQSGFEFKSPKDYAEQDAVAQQRALAAKNDAQIQETYPTHLKDVQAQERAANQQARVDARLARPVTEPNAARDMFTGAQRVADMSKPTERAPVETMPELRDRSAALYDEFQKAHEEYQKTGNDARLNEVLAQAKEELGPMDARLNRESTKPMFGTTGKPLKGALNEPKAVADQGAGRAGIPAPVPEAAKPARVEPVTERVAAPEPVADRPAMGEKPIARALDTKTAALEARNKLAAEKRAAKLEAPEVSEKTAGKSWETERDSSPDYPAFSEMHADAKDALQAKMELNGGRLTGQIMKEVRKAHKDAVRRDGIKEELSAGEGDAHLYRSEKSTGEATHTHSEAEALVNNIKSKWKNSPEVVVKETKDLHPEARAEVEKHDAKGFVDKAGRIVILSDRNANLGEVKATLFHEALGHSGLRAEFKDTLAKVMGNVYRTNPEIKAAADRYIADHPGTKKEHAVEEVLAEKQINGKVPQGVIAQVLAAVRSFARRMGMDVAYSAGDVASILRAAHDNVAKGSKPLVAAGEWAARAKDKERPLSRDVPINAKVTLEQVDADGKVQAVEVNARKQMREAEDRVNVLESLKECLGA